ncbi:SDR family oxidoreductase [Flavobacteriaceae bacterium M23B6Z8]
MRIDLSRKKALVGASTSGIGKAIALQLAACGASVTLMSRNKEKLVAVLNELDTSKQQKHGYLVVDFNNFGSFKTIITQFLSENSIDILVNNTQGPPSGSVLDKTPDDYQQAFDLLFQNIVATTLTAIQAMKENQYGRVINVASVSVKEPLSHLALSNAIRSALVSWSKTLATEVAKDRITVNTILTGYFNTERLEGLLHTKAEASGASFESIKKEKEAEVPSNRFGNPEEYGYLAAFLASDLASYITGANIPIDGGLLRSPW